MLSGASRPRSRARSRPWRAGGKADPTIEKAEIDLGGELILRAGARLPFTKDHPEDQTRLPSSRKSPAASSRSRRPRRSSSTATASANDLLATKLKLTAKVGDPPRQEPSGSTPSPQGQKLGSLKATAQPQTRRDPPPRRLRTRYRPRDRREAERRLGRGQLDLPRRTPPRAGLHLPIDGRRRPRPGRAKGGTLRIAGGNGTPSPRCRPALLERNLARLSALGNATPKSDPEPAPTFPGKLGRVPFVGLSVAAASFATDPKARTIAARGAADPPGGHRGPLQPGPPPKANTNSRRGEARDSERHRNDPVTRLPNRTWGSQCFQPWAVR